MRRVLRPVRCLALSVATKKPAVHSATAPTDLSSPAAWAQLLSGPRVFSSQRSRPGTGRVEGHAAWCWRPRVGDISYSLNVAGDAPVIVRTCERVRSPNPSGGTRCCRFGRSSGRTLAQARPTAPVRDPLGGVADQLAGRAQVEFFAHVAPVRV